MPGKFKCQSVTLNASSCLGRAGLCFAIGRKEELWLEKGTRRSVGRNAHKAWVSRR